MKKNILYLILVSCWFFVGTTATAHEGAFRVYGMDIIPIIGDISNINGEGSTITIIEFESKRLLTFSITKNTVVSICEKNVCNISKGLNAFNILGRYEDIGIRHKGSMVILLSLHDKQEALSVDMHLNHAEIKISP
jgi:hypothetical protein